MSRKETTSYETDGEKNVIGIVIQNPHFRKGMALEMARGQIQHAGKTECRLIGGNTTVVLSPEYLSDASKLEPDKKAEHIIAIAKGLRAASEIVIMRKSSKRKKGQ